MMCICFFFFSRLLAGSWVYCYQLTSTTKIFGVFWFDNGFCKLHYLASDAASWSFWSGTYASTLISLQTCFRNWYRWFKLQNAETFKNLKIYISQTNWLNLSELITIVQKLQNWVVCFTSVCSSDGQWILDRTIFAYRSAFKIQQVDWNLTWHFLFLLKKMLMFRNCQGHLC